MAVATRTAVVEIPLGQRREPLPDDILINILSFADRPTLAQCMAVSQCLFLLAVPALYTHVVATGLESQQRSNSPPLVSRITPESSRVRRRLMSQVETLWVPRHAPVFCRPDLAQAPLPLPNLRTLVLDYAQQPDRCGMAACGHSSFVDTPALGKIVITGLDRYEGPRTQNYFTQVSRWPRTRLPPASTVVVCCPGLVLLGTNGFFRPDSLGLDLDHLEELVIMPTDQSVGIMGSSQIRLDWAVGICRGLMRLVPLAGRSFRVTVVDYHLAMHIEDQRMSDGSKRNACQLFTDSLLHRIGTTPSPNENLEEVKRRWRFVTTAEYRSERKNECKIELEVPRSLSWDSSWICSSPPR